jgi:antitoxin (DNA-binding transcriptional repressor) of toxin-antitoxin stability system
LLRAPRRACDRNPPGSTIESPESVRHRPCHVDRRRRSAAPEASGDIPRARPWPCGYEAFSPAQPMYYSDCLIVGVCVKRRNITVTEAARNFVDCVNRVHYQDVTFVLLKNGSPVALLAPAQERVCPGRDLSAALAQTELPADEAKPGIVTFAPVERLSRRQRPAGDNS